MEANSLRQSHGGTNALRLATMMVKCVKRSWGRSASCTRAADHVAIMMTMAVVVTTTLTMAMLMPAMAMVKMTLTAVSMAVTMLLLMITVLAMSTMIMLINGDADDGDDWVGFSRPSHLCVKHLLCRKTLCAYACARFICSTRVPLMSYKQSVTCSLMPYKVCLHVELCINAVCARTQCSMTNI